MVAEEGFDHLGADTRIDFDAADGVTLSGISDPHRLHETDLIFAWFTAGGLRIAPQSAKSPGRRVF